MSEKKSRRVNAGEQPKLQFGANRIAEDMGAVKTYGVHLFPQGIKTMCANPKGKNNGKRGIRGKVAGWSKASRRRMREWMLTRYVPGFEVLAGNFTIPGPVMEPEKQKGLWDWFCREVDRRGWSMVWRMEIQSREALHWHTLLSMPPVPEGSTDKNRDMAEELWHDAIRHIGPETFITPHPLRNKTGVVFGLIEKVPHRMALPGATQHAAQVKDGRNEMGAWLRYLQDHASKTKQEQIAVGYGRHWGVVGRKRYRAGQEVEGYVMLPNEYFRFLRAFQRLCTPSFRTDGKPFGRSLGYRIRRGRRGNSVWFSRPDTIRKIVLWAKSEKAKHPGNPSGRKPGRLVPVDFNDHIERAT